MATSWSEEVEAEAYPEEFLTPQRGASRLDWRCGRGHFQNVALGGVCMRCGSELRLPEGYNFREDLHAFWEEETRTPESTEAMTPTESAQNTQAESEPQPGPSGFLESQDFDDFGLVKCVRGHIFPNSFHHCNFCGGMPIDNVNKESDEAAKESEPSGCEIDEFGLTQCSKGHVYHISMNFCNVCDPDKNLKLEEDRMNVTPEEVKKTVTFAEGNLTSDEDNMNVTPEEDKMNVTPEEVKKNLTAEEDNCHFARRPKYSPTSVRPMLSQMKTRYHWERYSEDKEQGQSTACQPIDEDEEE